MNDYSGKSLNKKIPWNRLNLTNFCIHSYPYILNSSERLNAVDKGNYLAAVMGVIEQYKE